MHLVFAHRTAALRLLACAVSLSALAVASPALADCTADSTGLIVTCSGTSGPYTNLASQVAVTAASGAAVTGPLVIGDNGSLANAGSITGTLTTPLVQYGNNAAITNTGTITSSGTVAAAAAIAVGDNATVTNSGTLTAPAGLPAVSFGGNGSFVDSAGATAAVTGNLVFGSSSGSSVSRFQNLSTAYGLSGNVIATGNTAIDNAGLWSGALTQTANGGSVTFTNETAGNYTGIVTTGDATTLVNNGTMTFGAGTAIGTSATLASTVSNSGAMTYLATATIGSAGTESSLANTGTLTIGSTTTPAKVEVLGNFSQGGAGVLNIAIKAPGSAVPTEGTNFSQLALTSGGAALGGTLNLSVAPGFYPTGSVYKVVVADQGISGNFATISGNGFAFIAFVPLGTVTVSGSQQAYEFQVQRTQTYAQALAGVGTASELALAAALQPVVASAAANPVSDAATLVGQIDVLTLPQAQAFLDGLSPQGYLAYATALRDQANMFGRAIALRLGDQNSDHPEDGWWGSGQGQFQFGGGGAGTSKSKLYGFNLGYDFSGSHHVLGIAGSASWDSLDYSGGTMSGTNRALALTGYAGWELGPLHLTGQLGYVFGHLGAGKTLALGTVTRSAQASASEHLLKANATAGFDLSAMGLTIEPYVGIDVARGRINGFTETGAAAADLTVAPISARRTDLLVGANVTRSTGMWRPYLHAAWRSALGTPGDSSVSAFLNGDPATAFTLTGGSVARHEIDADAGINVVFEDSGSLFVGYQGTMRSGLSAHGIDAGIRIEF